MLAHRS